MLRFIRHITSVLCAVALVLCFFSADAFAINIASWYDSQLYSVLSDGKPSNSAVDCITLRVKDDGDVNQLHMLFMAELTAFGKEENAGVKISFDGLGTITLMCDGTEEYDDEIFFAEITDTLFDSRSMTMYLEVTVGIKDGIPDTAMQFCLYDTDGVRSNTYTVEFEDEEDDVQQEEEEEKTSKTSKTRTTKSKTSRTTKKKTTKRKTTKRKTSRSTKSRTTKEKTTKSGKTKEDDYSVEENSTSISLDEEIAVSNDREKIMIACTAAVILCAVSGCAVGIANIIKKKKDK